MVNKIKIGDKIIGDNKTFIIAEAGLNHNGDIEIGKKLISKAKESGADAIKFQTYITEKRVVKDSPIFDILKKCELTNDQTKVLFDFAKEEGIIFFSTPFDIESAEFLIDLNVSLIKLASFHVTHHKLIEKVAKSKIPIIMSRGMTNEKELDAAVKIIEKYDCPYALLHCVSSYPLKDEDANLMAINAMKEIYDCPIGYSDHTQNVKVPSMAVAVGASIIEKHFTHDENYECPDGIISANPIDLKKLVDEIRYVEKILGTKKIELLNCEKGTLQYRKISGIDE
jgi:N,N'-diacetyllegionaminate synthase